MMMLDRNIWPVFQLPERHILNIFFPLFGIVQFLFINSVFEIPYSETDTFVFYSTWTLEKTYMNAIFYTLRSKLPTKFTLYEMGKRSSLTMQTL